MWEANKTDNRRVKIVDFQHVAFAYSYGGAPSLSTTIDMDGESQLINTTIPAYAIKWLNVLSDGGYHPTIVCFDSKGCTLSRKAYFEKFKVSVDGDVPLTKKGYKGSREPNDGDFYRGINITANLLIKANICIAKQERYEADDFVFLAVQKAKQQYPDLPIDVYTGDADLIPLVDDQVSVFIRSRKTTWAESKDLEKKHYVQLRPYNYQEYVNGLTNFKTINTPYNTVLFAKLFRGDKSDELLAKPDWKPTKYNNILETLVKDGYDLGEIFRYGSNISTICYRDTNQPIPSHLIDSVPKENKIRHFDDPVELTNLCEIMSHYVDDIDIIHIQHVYRGINLNACYKDVPTMFRRPPAVLARDIVGYDQGLLAQVVADLQINLPIR